jgi:peptidoglycan/xylan/chitin deacetylase (PgdA/CDA1 family)
LDARDTRATFFVLGWLAEREPEMVRAIASAGHVLALAIQDRMITPRKCTLVLRTDGKVS